jgi:hypothetical protein
MTSLYILYRVLSPPSSSTLHRKWSKRDAKLTRSTELAAKRRKNATKLCCFREFRSGFEPVIKDLLGTNATKAEYCSRTPRPRVGPAHHQADFGTPISIAGRRGGRPKGVSPGQTVVPDRIDVCPELRLRRIQKHRLHVTPRLSTMLGEGV